MDFKTKIKKLKLSHNGYLVLIILIGVVFMLFPSNSKPEKAPEVESKATTINYKNDLEEILSHIQGVGNVKVMLTYSSSMEKSIAYEKNTNKNEKKDGDNIINETSSKNNVVLASGEPFVTKEIYPEIQGVVVVADGADNIKVKQNISDAVTTALNIPPHKVCVIKKSDK